MKLLILAVFLSGMLLPWAAFSQGDHIEKIVILRHAEKPEAGLGQLTCQGLNRALMLPDYLAYHFPNPSYIFAPNPAVKVLEKLSGHETYSYVRPLATIEPTAIRLDMPINAQIGYNQPTKLVNELLKQKYHNATIYVAWEHLYIMEIAQQLLQQFNTDAKVPQWSNDNYSMVFVFTINWNKPEPTLEFTVTNQNFKHIATTCPKAYSAI